MAGSRSDAASPPPATAGLDGAVVAELRWLETHTGDPFVAGLVESFLGDAAAALASIERALAAGDGAATARAAHRVKGSAAGMGASEVAQTAAALEAAAARGDVAGAARLTGALAAALARVEPALRDLAATTASAVVRRP